MALIDMVLTDAERTERYGLDQKLAGRLLRRDVDTFVKWETDLINLSRGARYARSVKVATVEGHRAAILGYMGFVRMEFAVMPEDLSLAHYADPTKFLTFISYLKERLCGRRQVVKHVSIWVVCFLCVLHHEDACP